MARYAVQEDLSRHGTRSKKFWQRAVWQILILCLANAQHAVHRASKPEARGQQRWQTRGVRFAELAMISQKRVTRSIWTAILPATPRLMKMAFILIDIDQYT